MQRTRSHHHKLGGKFIATVSLYLPYLTLFKPTQLRHARMKERLIIQTVLRGDSPAVLEDFGCSRVFLSRHMPGFLKQRHINHGSGITHRAWVTIPIPRTTEIAALFNHAITRYSTFSKTRSRYQPSITAAYKGDIHMIVFRVTLLNFNIGVIKVFFKVFRHSEILIIAIRAQPLLALLCIFRFRFCYIHSGSKIYTCSVIIGGADNYARPVNLNLVNDFE